MKTSVLKLDTANKSIKLDGVDLLRVTKIFIECEAGRLPKVTIEIAANVEVDGVLLNKKLEVVRCDACGRRMGEFAEGYAVLCPDCKSLNFG